MPFSAASAWSTREPCSTKRRAAPCTRSGVACAPPTAAGPCGTSPSRAADGAAAAAASGTCNREIASRRRSHGRLAPMMMAPCTARQPATTTRRRYSLSPRSTLTGSPPSRRTSSRGWLRCPSRRCSTCRAPYAPASAKSLPPSLKAANSGDATVAALEQARAKLLLAVAPRKANAAQEMRAFRPLGRARFRAAARARQGASQRVRRPPNWAQ